MNWLQLLSCLARELVKGPMSEALPKPKVLEGGYRGITDENHSPSHPHTQSEQLASIQPVRYLRKQVTAFLRSDFIFTTIGLEHDQGEKRQFHLRVSLMDRTVQKRVGTEDKEDKFFWLRNKTHLLLQRSK